MSKDGKISMRAGRSLAHCLRNFRTEYVGVGKKIPCTVILLDLAVEGRGSKSHYSVHDHLV